MHRFLSICLMLLASCGPTTNDTTVIKVRTYVPPDLLTTCAGWRGAAPETEGQLIEAAHAEKTGRLCANGKIVSIREIVTAPVDNGPR